MNSWLVIPPRTFGQVFGLYTHSLAYKTKSRNRVESTRWHKNLVDAWTSGSLLLWGNVRSVVCAQPATISVWAFYSTIGYYSVAFINNIFSLGVIQSSLKNMKSPNAYYLFHFHHSYSWSSRNLRIQSKIYCNYYLEKTVGFNYSRCINTSLNTSPRAHLSKLPEKISLLSSRHHF